MKEQLLTLTRQHLGEMTTLQKAVRSSAAARITQASILASGQKVARTWFDQVRPALERVAFHPDTHYKPFRAFREPAQVMRHAPYEDRGFCRSSATELPHTLSDLIHQIEIGSFSSTGGLSIAPYIEGLPSDEGEYLDEAQRCLSVNALRGCIVLGWCATIARIHAKIVDIGYDKFNKASEEMFDKKVGRYKPFNKKFAVDSVAELPAHL